MRARYAVTGIILARTPLAEASATLFLLTPEFGLIRARAQGIRQSGAKLSIALQTLSEADVILVRGKEAWRLSGATPVLRHFGELSPDARARAGRVAQLILRLVQGEVREPELYFSYKSFLEALPMLTEQEAVTAECLAVLRILRTLGLDAGELPEGTESFSDEALSHAQAIQTELFRRANRGIAASGL